MKIFYTSDPYTGRCDPLCPVHHGACVGSQYCKILCGGCVYFGTETDSEGHIVGKYVECNKTQPKSL